MLKVFKKKKSKFLTNFFWRFWNFCENFGNVFHTFKNVFFKINFVSFFVSFSSLSIIDAYFPVTKAKISTVTAPVIRSHLIRRQSVYQWTYSEFRPKKYFSEKFTETYFKKWDRIHRTRSTTVGNCCFCRALLNYNIRSLPPFCLVPKITTTLLFNNSNNKTITALMNKT